jgi:deoxycytidylate deaminase
MTVIRHMPRGYCPRCGSERGPLPHSTVHDCLAALHAEMNDLFHRMTELTGTRSKVLERQLAAAREQGRRIARRLKKKPQSA